MAADICILDLRPAQAGFIDIRVLFWITVANPFPNPNFVSAYPAISTDPATSTLSASLSAGTVIEEQNHFLFPLNWITTQWVAIEALLLAYLNARKAVRTGTVLALPDPGLKYKILHDTVTNWSA